MKTYLTNLRTRIAEKNERRRGLRSLEWQLSQYRSPSERAELDAMIARSDADTSDVQAILTNIDRRRAMDGVRDMYMTTGLR